MGKYIVKRVLQFIPVFLGVTLILFALQNIVPGDPIKLIGGDKALSPEVELQLRVRYHLVQTDEDGNAILDENGDPVRGPLLVLHERPASWRSGQFVSAQAAGYGNLCPEVSVYGQTCRVRHRARGNYGYRCGYHFGGKALFLLGYFGNAHHVDPRCGPGLLARYVAAAVL